MEAKQTVFQKLESKQELTERIYKLKEQAKAAYDIDLVDVGDLLTSKARELQEQIDNMGVVEEVKDDAPFRHSIGSAKCIECIKSHFKERPDPENYSFDCSGCEQSCRVVVLPEYLGINEDGMTLWIPISNIEGGLTS